MCLPLFNKIDFNQKKLPQSSIKKLVIELKAQVPFD